MDKISIEKNDMFKDAISKLFVLPPNSLTDSEKYCIEIFKNVIEKNAEIATSRIYDFVYSKEALTACTFVNKANEISVAFKGTGSGEWIDNGEGLSGIPEENTYITYTKNGQEAFKYTVSEDYATDQQVEALNWFNYMCSKNNWNIFNKITVSGHSKGGNKAQFIAINSPLPRLCISFDGQGFSPEAIQSFKNMYGNNAFNFKTADIFSISSENDYVNVLGKRLMPDKNIFYLQSKNGLHNLDAILDFKGDFRAPATQGILSKYIQTVSDELMEFPPAIRKYATTGIMNIFQKYLGKNEPVNGDFVSVEETLAGIGIAITTFIRQLNKFKS